MAIINSSFSNNTAKANGPCGAVCIDSGRGLRILNSNFNNNVANRMLSGGALYIDNTGRSVNITNCYFRNNAAVFGNQNGGAINIDQGMVKVSDSYFIDNTVATNSS